MDHAYEIRVTRAREPAAADPVPPHLEGVVHTVDASVRLPRLAPLDKLVVVAMARRYLAAEDRPSPLPWAPVAEELTDVDPGRAWNRRVVENRLRRVRDAPSRAGVPGLRAAELEPSIGNQNLAVALMRARAIRPDDLDELGFR